MDTNVKRSVTLTVKDIEEMEQIKWWHSIRLGSVVTQGITHPLTHQWKSLAIPEDLSGLTVLDIGSWDGYYSFLAESRGARRILAIDIFQGWCNDGGFKFAKRVLGSKVEHKFQSVYDLDDLGERFDLILFLGVYYHLVDPILALQQIYQALNDGGILVIEGEAFSGHKPILRALKPSERPDPTVYCTATVPWFQVIGEQIGYQDFELISIRMQWGPKARSPVRRAKKLARSIAWNLGLTFGPFRERDRALIRMRRGG